jgi:hypothetical protein
VTTLQQLHNLKTRMDCCFLLIAKYEPEDDIWTWPRVQPKPGVWRRMLCTTIDFLESLLPSSGVQQLMACRGWTGPIVLGHRKGPVQIEVRSNSSGFAANLLNQRRTNTNPAFGGEGSSLIK